MDPQDAGAVALQEVVVAGAINQQSQQTDARNTGANASSGEPLADPLRQQCRVGFKMSAMLCNGGGVDSPSNMSKNEFFVLRCSVLSPGQALRDLAAGRLCNTGLRLLRLD